MGRKYHELISYGGIYFRSPKSTNERRQMEGIFKDEDYCPNCHDRKRRRVLIFDANAWADKQVKAYSPWMPNIYRNKLQNRNIRKFRKLRKRHEIEENTEE